MVEGVAERASPFLVPVGATSGGATAVSVPATDSVSTAPCTAFAVEILEFDFVLGRELFEEPAVVYRNHVVLRSELVVKPCGAHVAKWFVVAVRFAVSADAYELRLAAIGVPGAFNAVSECSCVAEQVLEADGARKPRIVEEYVEVTVADEVAILVARIDAVRARRVNVRVATVGPLLVAKLAELVCLRGRENGVFDAGFDKFNDGLKIDGGFGKPHGFGHATEMELEIFNAPADLRTLVLRTCKRHDDVVVNLSNCVTVPVHAFLAALVGVLNALVGVGRIGADPAHKSRADVKAHEIVVVYDIDNFAFRI